MFPSKSFNRLNNHWFVLILFFIFSSLWLMNTWGPAPVILTNGDAGNVSSIVASIMNPERFSHDPLFSNANNFKFYWTISIPLTKFLSHFTHDIGQAYLLLIWPIIMAQLIGFYLLGLYLFSRRSWAFLLALISLSPIYVFGGELWGQLDVPLTRSYYGALFPYILLIALQKNNKVWFPFAVMFLCGLSVYVHPVSAPSVSFACLSALLMCKPDEQSWVKQILVIIAAGVFFLIVSSPFMISFFGGFPSSASINNDSNATIAAHYMTQAAGPQYYQVSIVLKSLWALLTRWEWCLFWTMGIVGLLILPIYSKNPYYERKFFIFFTIGLLVSSLGVAWFDQTIARMNSRYPFEIDLVRNVRYLIPLLLIGVIRLLVNIDIKIPGKYRPVFLFLVMVIVFRWIMAFPTTISNFVTNKFIHHDHVEDPINNFSNRNMLNYIKKLPSGSKIMAFPQDHISNSIVEFLMFAVRYSSLQPVAHLKKDLNFLSYSGNGLKILEWQNAAKQIELINNADIQTKLQLLKEFMQKYQVNFLLIYEPSVSTELKNLLNIHFKLLYRQRNFSLYAC